MQKVEALTDLYPQNVVGPCIAAFTPLHHQNHENFKVKMTSHKFGKHGLELDVYQAENVKGGKPKCLLWTYGGGFGQGAKQEPDTLIFQNLGGYFAKRGIMTIVADYRLTSAGGKYPSTGLDLQEAIHWIKDNLAEQANVDSLTCIGTSAGAMTIAAYLLDPQFYAKDSSKYRPSGAVLTSLVATLPAPYPPPMLAYYGTDEVMASSMPLQLLERLDKSTGATLPPTLNVFPPREMPGVAEVGKEFTKLANEKGWKVKAVTMKENHNHVSYCLALGSGEGEEWAQDVLDFVEQH